LDRLGPQHISQYRDERLAKIRVKSSDGSQAVRHDLNLLSNIFTVAAKEWGISVENFVHSVRKPSPAKSRERRITDIEVERLLESASPLLGSMIELALETGMRRGEIHRLHGSDMDLQNRLLQIPVTKNGFPRTIPISLKAAEILSVSSPELPFNMTEAQFRYRCKTLLNLAQITDLHFHDLRHEAISRFFEMGLSVPEVALISGHKDPRMLFRYTHLRAEDVVKKLK
jgi:integrase